MTTTKTERTENPVADLLRRARGLIETEDRWIKGDYYQIRNGVGCYCMAGAFRAAAEASTYPPSVVRAAYDFLADSVGFSRNPIGFNDALRRTHAEVLDMMDRAIAAAEGEDA